MLRSNSKKYRYIMYIVYGTEYDNNQIRKFIISY